MPETPVRRKRGRPTRDRAPDRGEIVRVALAAFARDGFDGTNLRRIAAEAGVDVALISRHFGPKLDLWKAVVDELARRMATAQSEIVAPHGTDKPSGEQIADALRLPPERARTALTNVKLGSLPFPSPLKVNEQREVIGAARQKVLDALAR
jgi:Transcriptional regulator